MLLLTATFFQEVQRLVSGNAIQPSRDLRFSTEAFYRLPRLNERILNKVVCIFMRIDHTANLPIDLLGVETHNKRKRHPPRARLGKLALQFFFGNQWGSHRWFFTWRRGRVTL